MAGVAANSDDRKSRETSVSELLDYKISFGEDGTLQWDPPAGSQELALALSYHYPVEGDVAGKMRAAVKTFLRARRRVGLEEGEVSGRKAPEKSSFKGGGFESDKKAEEVERNENGNAGSQPSKSQESLHDSKQVVKGDLEFLVWDPKLKGVKRQGRKRPYEKVEGAKVAANRGYVCDEHRRQKMKCDPDMCPRNGQRLKMTDSSEILNASATFSDNSISLPDSVKQTSKSLGRFVDIKPSSGLHSTGHQSKDIDHDFAATTDHLSSATQPQLTMPSNSAGNDALGTSAAVTRAPPNQADSFFSSNSDHFLLDNDELVQELSPVAFNASIADNSDFSSLFNVDPLLFSYDIELDSSDVFSDDWAAFQSSISDPMSSELNSPKAVEVTAVIERERKPYTCAPDAYKLPTVPEISVVAESESGESSPNGADRLSSPDLAYHERLDFLLGNTARTKPGRTSSSSGNIASKDTPGKGPRRGSSAADLSSKYTRYSTSTTSSSFNPSQTSNQSFYPFSTLSIPPPPPHLFDARGSCKKSRYIPSSKRETEGESTSNSEFNSPMEADRWDRYRANRSRRDTEGGSTSNSEFNSPRDAERWDRYQENQSDRTERSYERGSVPRYSGYATDENWYRTRGSRESRSGYAASSIEDLGDIFARIEL